jgi:hypothetical protein
MLRQLSSPLLPTTQTILNTHPQTFRAKHVPGYPAPRLLFSLGLNLARPLVLQPSSVVASGSRWKIFYKHVFTPTTHLPYTAVLVCISLTTCSSSRLADFLVHSLPVYYSYLFTTQYGYTTRTTPCQHIHLSSIVHSPSNIV